jgi:RNA polymerase sigma factor (sigma-70 family)
MPDSTPSEDRGDNSKVSETIEPVSYAPGATSPRKESWRGIYERFADAILAYSRRCGLDEHSAEAVLQEVITTVIRCQHDQMAGRDPPVGDFQAWLWGVIRNRVRSVRRKDEKEEMASPTDEGDSKQAGGPLPEVTEVPPNLAMREEAEWQRALMSAAFRRMQQRVTPENFVIYTALLRQEQAPEQLARTYGKDSDAISAAKHRCETILLAESEALKAAWKGLG